LDIGQISNSIRPLLAGQTATTWQDPTGEERDVVVQVAPEQRTNLQNLLTLPIATGNRTEFGAVNTVPLGQIATITEGSAPPPLPLTSGDPAGFGGGNPGPPGQDPTIPEGSAAAQIDRLHLGRVSTVAANINILTSMAEASTAVQEVVDGMELPAGYSAVLGG